MTVFQGGIILQAPDTSHSLVEEKKKKKKRGEGLKLLCGGGRTNGGLPPRTSSIPKGKKKKGEVVRGLSRPGTEYERGGRETKRQAARSSFPSSKRKREKKTSSSIHRPQQKKENCGATAGIRGKKREKKRGLVCPTENHILKLMAGSTPILGEKKGKGKKKGLMTASCLTGGQPRKRDLPAQGSERRPSKKGGGGRPVWGQRKKKGVAPKKFNAFIVVIR